MLNKFGWCIEINMKHGVYEPKCVLWCLGESHDGGTQIKFGNRLTWLRLPFDIRFLKSCYVSTALLL